MAATLLGLLVVLAWYRAPVANALGKSVEFVEGLGPFGPVAFIAIYILATVLMVPGAALGLAAGAIFGVAAGTAWVSAGSTLGAGCAFLIARFLARDAVAGLVASRMSLATLDQAMEREGWKVVLLARLSPVFPFNLLNYALGLTRVRFSHYLAASWIGMLPGTLLFVYLGSLARAGLRPEERTPLEWGLYGVGLAATIGVTIIVTRMARNAMRKQADTNR